MFGKRKRKSHKALNHVQDVILYLMEADITITSSRQTCDRHKPLFSFIAGSANGKVVSKNTGATVPQVSEAFKPADTRF